MYKDVNVPYMMRILMQTSKMVLVFIVGEMRLNDGKSKSAQLIAGMLQSAGSVVVEVLASGRL